MPFGIMSDDRSERIRLAAWIGIAFCLAAATRSANAAITYQYVTDATGYQAAPSGTLTINLYLQEAVNAGSASLLASEGGLYGAGIRVTRTQGTSVAISSFTLNTAGFSGNTESDPLNAGSVSFTEARANNAAGVTATTVSTGVSRVFLGSLQLFASTGASTTFSLAPYYSPGDPSKSVGGNTLTNTNFSDLDTDSSGQIGAPTVAFANTAGEPYSFTVNAPEPGCALGVTACLVAMNWIPRRRKTRQALSKESLCGR